MESTVNQRINQVISALKISKINFANKANMPYQTLINIIGERHTKPSYDAIEKILTNFDNINPDWLLVGRGEMFKDSMPEKTLPPKEESRSSQVSEEWRATVEKLENFYERQILFLQHQLESKDKQIEQLMGKYSVSKVPHGQQLIFGR